MPARKPVKQQTQPEPQQVEEIPTLEEQLEEHADAISVSVGTITRRGEMQLQALQAQQADYVEAFAQVASDLIVETELMAWEKTAELTAQKLGAYSPADAVAVFSAFSLSPQELRNRLAGIRETAALAQGKATAGF